MSNFFEDMRTTNYAGRSLYYGLGFIWLIWGAVVLFFFWQLGAAIIAVFLLGLIDDLYGSSQSKGFKGHLRALSKGKVTTGFIKLAGISLVSFLYALSPNVYNVWTGSAGRELSPITGVFWPPDAHLFSIRNIAAALVVGAAIALASNFINLMDLRPGRAIKAYLLLTLVAEYFPVTIMVAGSAISSTATTPISEALNPANLLAIGFLSFIPWFLFALPMLIVLSPDLKEKAMLGDAGANAAGFAAGAFAVLWLPLWGVVLFLVLMLALNYASEKISFSQVIENNPLLTQIDNIGRLKSGD
jgi:hypothetical protein